MQNENLTPEIAEEAVTIVSAAVELMSERKLVSDMNAYIVIAHPLAVINEGKFEILYETRLSVLDCPKVTMVLARLNAGTAIPIRDMRRRSQVVICTVGAQTPLGTALRHEIVVGVFGLSPKHFNQLVADMIADVCNSLCYQAINT